MKTEHYPSLELCKKLKEIGFPDTEKHWYQYDVDNIKIGNYKNEHFYSICPSVMEMLDVIPQRLNDEYWFKNEMEQDEDGKYYCITYIKPGSYSLFFPSFNESSLPNALAEMIIWLVENKYLSFN